MTKYAPKNDDGLYAYVVTESFSWGRSHDRIEWAESLKQAKSRYGWTRQRHTCRSVRRATPEELAALS
jgi:hypothetical protein